MMLELPKDVEEWIRGEVDRGHFASTGEVIIEAVRHLARERRWEDGAQPAPVEPGPEVRKVIEELKEFARGNSLGEGLTIRDMIEEGRKY